jgi:hypothetical protein
MGWLADAANTVRYALSAKNVPAIPPYMTVISDLGNPAVMDQGYPDPFDTKNYERVTGGPYSTRVDPSAGWIFETARVPQSQTDAWLQEYYDLCRSYGMKEPYPQPKRPWLYSSKGCHSQSKFRVDIYRPGRIVSRCTLPSEGNAAVWLYVSENPGDFNNPYRNPIDVWTGPRDFYWEIDTEETFGNRVGFAGHYGTQSDRKMKNESLCTRLGDDRWHHPEVRWDGRDNWEWWLDGVRIHSKNIPTPKGVGRIYPYLILGYVPMDVMEAPRSIWQVEYVAITTANIIRL